MSDYIRKKEPVGIDIPVEVESLSHKEDPLEYLLAVKDSLEKEEFGHYTLAQLMYLHSNVDKAYGKLPEHAKPCLMNEYITIWSGLLDLKEKRGYSNKIEAEPSTRKPKR